MHPGSDNEVERLASRLAPAYTLDGDRYPWNEWGPMLQGLTSGRAVERLCCERVQEWWAAFKQVEDDVDGESESSEDAVLLEESKQLCLELSDKYVDSTVVCMVCVVCGVCSVCCVCVCVCVCIGAAVLGWIGWLLILLVSTCLYWCGDGVTTASAL